MLNLSYDPVVLHSVEFLLQSRLEVDAALAWYVDRWARISLQEETSFAFRVAYASKLTRKLLLEDTMEVTVVLCAVPAGTEQLALDLIALIVTSYASVRMRATLEWLVRRHLRRRTYIYATDNPCSDKEFSERRNIQFHHRYELLT